MKKIHALLLTTLATSCVIPFAQANTVSVTGNILYTTQFNSESGQDETGTTYDAWKINMQTAGTFKVNVLAFESTSNDAADASDINGDGELTYLDPDTYWYKNTGNPIQAADMLARCDDIANNCDSIDTPTIKLDSLSKEEGESDGSIHERRDPAFEVTLAAGEYLYLMADYRLSSSDAEDGFDFGNSIRNTDVGGHADYQIMFSSDTLNFDVSGDTINVSAVPVPAAFWLFGSAVIGLIARKKS